MIILLTPSPQLSTWFMDVPFAFCNYPLTLLMNGAAVIFEPPKIFHKSMSTELNMPPIVLNCPRIPYEINIHGNHTTNFEYMEEKYSKCGFKLQFHRKSIDLLLESFYMPTAIFSILSWISYLIHPDKVSPLTINGVIHKPC